jgi:hypothetical protein
MYTQSEYHIFGRTTPPVSQGAGVTIAKGAKFKKSIQQKQTKIDKSHTIGETKTITPKKKK